MSFRCHSFYRVLICLLVLFAAIELRADSNAIIKSANLNTAQTSQEQAHSATPTDTQSAKPQSAKPQSPEPKLAQPAKKQTTRAAFYETATDFANWVDRFFGEQRALESASFDYLSLVSEFYLQEREGVKFRPRLKAKVHLPGIDNKFSLLFEDVSGDRSYDEKTNQDRLSELDRSGTTAAAINYQSDQYDRSQFDSRIGLGSGLKPFAQIKHTFNVYQTNDFSFRNFNYLFWKENKGFGARTLFEMDKRVSETQLFRWQYSLLRAEKSLGNEWFTQVTWNKELSENSWRALSASAKGFSDYHFLVESYRLASRWRWRSSREWLFYEVEPEIIWKREPEDNHREPLAGIYFRVEIQFGH
ncbi:hypothetical protein ACUR5C_05935 [Aliikangiella sp. IMCC44653]